jgi:prespore-specific regulator
MTATRQDAWTPDDDLILAEVALRHIREGGTQLSAFEEVGERIGRTAAACGFRWNSAIRKKYEAAIQIAKAQRQKRKQKKTVPSETRSYTSDFVIEEKVEAGSDDVISFDAVIRFLRHHKGYHSELSKKVKQLESQLQELQEQNLILRKESEQFKSKYQHVQTDYQVVNDDYKALIQIMDRARKMAFLVDESENDFKPRFKMDANGNLERVDR